MRDQIRVFMPLALVGLACAVSSCSSGPSISGAQRVSIVTDAVNNASSVHFVDTDTIGNQRQIATGSISAPFAQVVVTHQNQVILMTRLVGTHAYFWSSEVSVVENALNLTTPVATKVVGKWISLRSTDKPFSPILSSMSINSEVSAFLPNPDLALTQGSQRKIHGLDAVPLSQSTSSQNLGKALTLYVSPRSNLPLAGVVIGKTKKTSETKQAIFSDWNKQVSVSAPSSAIPFDSLLHA
jgi:hypothetical protein